MIACSCYDSAMKSFNVSMLKHFFRYHFENRPLPSLITLRISLHNSISAVRYCLKNYLLFDMVTCFKNYLLRDEKCSMFKAKKRKTEIVRLLAIASCCEYERLWEILRTVPSSTQTVFLSSRHRVRSTPNWKRIEDASHCAESLLAL